MNFNTTDDVLKFKKPKTFEELIQNDPFHLLDSSLDTQKQVNTDVKKKSSGVHL